MTMRRLLVLALLPVLIAPRALHSETAPPPPESPDRPTTEKPAPEKPKPVVNSVPNAEDVATTPLSDLNIKKAKIPPVLLRAQAAPYSLSGMRNCASLRAEVSDLTAVLGDDVDSAQRKGKPVIPGKVAQDLVGGLIPFRGVVREITGANAENRAMQQAIYAGFARRAFLKGVGLQRRCPYPARPN